MFKTLIKNIFGCGCDSETTESKLAQSEQSSCCATKTKEVSSCCAKTEEVKSTASNTVDVVIESAVMNRILVEKVLRTNAGLSSTEAEKMLNSLPAAVKKGIDKQEANELKEKLEELGAKVTLK